MGAGVAKAAGPILVGFWMAYCLSWDDNIIGRENEMYVPMDHWMEAWRVLPIVVHMHKLHKLDCT